MDTIFTFWTLCKKYSKIEIPIIQRDYAQGRETADVEKIRKKFINDYLIDSLLQEKKVELDFVYGTELKPAEGDLKQELFIPLDGQQRLTTLFLLHWFIALKEGRVADARDNLLKFTYETRPSAHDFCRLLIGKPTSENITAIKKEILESEWYDDEWDNDPTVRGMITMLDTFSKNRQLAEHPGKLFDLLISVCPYSSPFC